MSWSEQAARFIIQDLEYRSGLGDVWQQIDGETREEIAAVWAGLIAKAQRFFAEERRKEERQHAQIRDAILTALRTLVAAERQFERETGLSTDDNVTRALALAEETLRQVGGAR